MLMGIALSLAWTIALVTSTVWLKRCSSFGAPAGLLHLPMDIKADGCHSATFRNRVGL